MICSIRTTSLSSHPGAAHAIQPSELLGVSVRGITKLCLHPELPRVIAPNCVMHRVALESQECIFFLDFVHC